MTMIDMTNLDTRRKVQLLSLISSLSFEVNMPGMKMSRHFNTTTVATQMGYTGPRSKKKALKWAVDTLKDLDPGYVPGESTQKALDK